MSAASSPQATELTILDLLVPKLEGQGYTVFLDPLPSLLPPTFGSYRPDLIAVKPDRKLAIDVLASPKARRPKLVDGAARVAAEKGWEHQIVYAPIASSGPEIRAPEPDVFDRTADGVAAAFHAAGAVSAILLAWSLLEAAARTALPAALTRPQSGASLVEALQAEGCVDADEAAFLARMSSIRNLAAHGQLDVAVSDADLGRLTAIARAVRQLA